MQEEREGQQLITSSGNIYRSFALTFLSSRVSFLVHSQHEVAAGQVAPDVRVAAVLLS